MILKLLFDILLYMWCVIKCDVWWGRILFSCTYKMNDSCYNFDRHTETYLISKLSFILYNDTGRFWEYTILYYYICIILCEYLILQFHSFIFKSWESKIVSTKKKSIILSSSQVTTARNIKVRFWYLLGLFVLILHGY